MMRWFLVPSSGLQWAAPDCGNGYDHHHLDDHHRFDDHQHLDDHHYNFDDHHYNLDGDHHFDDQYSVQLPFDHHRCATMVKGGRDGVGQIG